MGHTYREELREVAAEIWEDRRAMAAIATLMLVPGVLIVGIVVLVLVLFG